MEELTRPGIEQRIILCHPDCASGEFRKRLEPRWRVDSVAEESDLAETVRALRLQNPDAAVFVILPKQRYSIVPELRECGVVDFVLWPCSEAEFAVRLGLPARTASPKIPAIVGDDPAILQLQEQIQKLARVDAPLLIRGETGTGKELMARTLHAMSDRADQPFVPINCGAIPEALFESECFGHEQGAFTDARKARKGLFGQAMYGTVFLDEIDSLAPSNQVKLLRFLEDKEYRPIGSDLPIQIDVRILAATSADLVDLERRNLFRADLRYRLDVLSMDVPPLRTRRGDIPRLALHFVELFAATYGRSVWNLTPQAATALSEWDWPGNVRELKNVIHRAVVRAEGDVIDVGDLGLQRPAGPTPKTLREAKAREIQEFEKNFIQMLLTRHNGNVTHAAREAGKDRRAFRALMKKYGIRREPNPSDGFGS
jgi:two-component system response regulator GlrR